MKYKNLASLSVNSIHFIIIVRTNVKDDDLNFIDLEKQLNSKIIIKNF